MDQLARQLGADDAAAEHEDVHVVVLHALVGRVRVVAETGADPGNPIRGHRRADAAAAHDDAALGPVFTQRFGDRLRVLAIVAGLAAVGADVDDLVVLLGERAGDALLEIETGAIRSDGDAHGCPARPPRVSRRC